MNFNDYLTQDPNSFTQSNNFPNVCWDICDICGIFKTKIPEKNPPIELMGKKLLILLFKSKLLMFLQSDWAQLVKFELALI